MTIFVYKGLAKNQEIGNTPEFCPIPDDSSRLGTPNLPQMTLIIIYYILQNTMIPAFTVSELLRENQQGGG